jgi:hypothetical protein
MRITQTNARFVLRKRAKAIFLKNNQMAVPYDI